MSCWLSGWSLPTAGRRDRSPFHNLRTLSTSIALEAAELMEHTQWAKDADLPTLAQQHRPRLPDRGPGRAGAGRGDGGPPCRRHGIAILLTYLAHDLDLDLEAAACLRQVNAPEAAEERHQVPRGEPACRQAGAKGVATKYDRL